jgi:hypothetical protein
MQISKALRLFKIPQVVAALKKLLGSISVKSFLALLKKGKDVAKNLGRKLRDKMWFMIEHKKLPTLTDLVERTELGLKAKGLYKVHLESGVDIVEQWFKKYMPTLSKVLIAALFAYIWINVAEISWEPADLIRGFLGQITLHELIKSLPESAVGFVLANVFYGTVGFTLMPFMLIPRLAWLLAKGYITYRTGKFAAEPLPT